jgi:hypothetical protein
LPGHVHHAGDAFAFCFERTLFPLHFAQATRVLRIAQNGRAILAERQGRSGLNDVVRKGGGRRVDGERSDERYEQGKEEETCSGTLGGFPQPMKAFHQVSFQMNDGVKLAGKRMLNQNEGILLGA